MHLLCETQQQLLIVLFYMFLFPNSLPLTVSMEYTVVQHLVILYY